MVCVVNKKWGVVEEEAEEEEEDEKEKAQK